MVANEVFIDSATLRENVVALAKNIGYTPKSKKASRCTVDFFVDLDELSTSPPSVTLKAGPVAATSNQFGGQSYVFNVLEDTTCLLYTSPSPRDLSTSRMPSSA